MRGCIRRKITENPFKDLKKSGVKKQAGWFSERKAHPVCFFASRKGEDYAFF